jgi:hypothetical protein
MKRIAVLAILLGVFLALLAEAQHVFHWLGTTPGIQGLSYVVAAAGLLLVAAGLWLGFRHQPHQPAHDRTTSM